MPTDPDIAIALLFERQHVMSQELAAQRHIITRLEQAYWKVVGAATLGGTFGGLILLAISKLWK